MSAPDEDHYWLVASRICEGRVIPFLGAGANLCGRPSDAKFELGRFLPNGPELAHALAVKYRYPEESDLDLLRVSQYVDAILGEGALYEYLRSLFNHDYPPNDLHRLLAKIAGLLRESGMPRQLILTTNYDDLLERAFEERGEQYDVITYEAKQGRSCGKFVHRPDPGVTDADGPCRRNSVVIDIPNEYADLSLDERTVILKLHGAVDRGNPACDSFVITEDNYIDYLTHSDISSQIPMTLRQAMEDSHFLFLGYSMRDWNLRVILNRIWGPRQLDLSSWAVQLAPAALGDGSDAEAQRRARRAMSVEQKLWASRGHVDLYHVPLEAYVASLDAELHAGHAATELAG
jgi:SIR2-like domain